MNTENPKSVPTGKVFRICGFSIPEVLIPCRDCGETGACAPSCPQVTDSEPSHQFGCVCADCSGAELTADND